MHLKNWLVAAGAVGLGIAVSAALLVFGNPARDQVDVLAVARDVAAGSPITSDALRLVAIGLPEGTTSLYLASDAAQVEGTRAMRDLVAGQLLQRGDVASTSAPDVRLVYLPVKDAPPAAPGSRLDLLVIGGTADRPTVTPFALGVEVRAVVAGGFVVSVSSRQAPAFVYAAEVMRLVAVVASGDAGPGSEEPVDAPDQALAMAAQP